MHSSSNRWARTLSGPHWPRKYVADTNISYCSSYTSSQLVSEQMPTHTELLWTLHVVHVSWIYGNMRYTCDHFSRCGGVSSTMSSKDWKAWERQQLTFDVNIKNTLLLYWYSHYSGHTYSHAHLTAVTYVNHFTCNTHTRRVGLLGAEFSLTDGLTFTDSYNLICFSWLAPTHTHKLTPSRTLVEESRQWAQQSFTAEWALLGLQFELSTADGSGKAGRDHNTHHMSPGNHQEQNKPINRLPAACTPDSFAPKMASNSL